MWTSSSSYKHRMSASSSTPSWTTPTKKAPWRNTALSFTIPLEICFCRKMLLSLLFTSHYACKCQKCVKLIWELSDCLSFPLQLPSSSLLIHRIFTRRFFCQFPKPAFNTLLISNVSKTRGRSGRSRLDSSACKHQKTFIRTSLTIMARRRLVTNWRD